MVDIEGTDRHQRPPDAVILQTSAQLLYRATQTVETSDGGYLNLAHRVRQPVHDVVHQILTLNHLHIITRVRSTKQSSHRMTGGAIKDILVHSRVHWTSE